MEANGEQLSSLLQLQAVVTAKAVSGAFVAPKRNDGEGQRTGTPSAGQFDDDAITEHPRVRRGDIDAYWLPRWRRSTDGTVGRGLGDPATDRAIRQLLVRRVVTYIRRQIGVTTNSP